MISTLEIIHLKTLSNSIIIYKNQHFSWCSGKALFLKVQVTLMCLMFVGDQKNIPGFATGCIVITPSGSFFVVQEMLSSQPGLAAYSDSANKLLDRLHETLVAQPCTAYMHTSMSNSETWAGGSLFLLG